MSLPVDHSCRLVKKMAMRPPKCINGARLFDGLDIGVPNQNNNPKEWCFTPKIYMIIYVCLFCEGSPFMLVQSNLAAAKRVPTQTVRIYIYIYISNIYIYISNIYK